MPTDTREPQHSAVSEAARITAESSRRTTENARAAVAASRDLVDAATNVNRKLFDVWVGGAEAGLKASFDLQNASLSAGAQLVEAASAGQLAVLKQWDAAAREAQQAALQWFSVQVRATNRLFEQAA